MCWSGSPRAARKRVGAALGVVLGVALGIASPSPGFAGAEPVVSFVDGGLSIEAIGVTGGDLLSEIARQTGLEIRAPGVDLRRAVTISLRDAPVAEGVRAVLRQIGGTNYAVLYDPVSELPVEVVVLADGRVETRSLASAATAPPAPPAEVAAPPATQGFFGRRDAPRAERGEQRRVEARARRARVKERVGGLLEGIRSRATAVSDGQPGEIEPEEEP